MGLEYGARIFAILLKDDVVYFLTGISAAFQVALSNRRRRVQSAGLVAA